MGQGVGGDQTLVGVAGMHLLDILTGYLKTLPTCSNFYFLRFIEEPTAPDDVLGHLHVRQSLQTPTTPSGPIIQVASGEHAHSRILFKQLLKTRAIDVCQIDSCRLAGVSEVLSVLLMAAKEGILVCPHAGGVGLCEMVIHLRSVTLSCFALVNVDTDKGSTQFN